MSNDFECTSRCYSPIACGGFGYCRNLNFVDTYNLHPARYRPDPAPALIDNTRTNVIVIGRKYKGRNGYINGTFERASGVEKVFVYFPSDKSGVAPKVVQMYLSSLAPIFL